MTTIEIDAKIPIDIKQGDSGLFFGTSKLVRGLLVTGKSEDEVIRKAPGLLRDLSDACKASS